MFTGLVQRIGVVVSRAKSRSGERLCVHVDEPLTHDRPGDSISVNGVCLTIVDIRASEFDADVIPQTLSMTTLGALEVGARVNLESALRMGDPMGGHIVQGHIDSIGEVCAIDRANQACRLRVHLPADSLGPVVAQGSITVQGVSLTIAACGADWFEVALIPETLTRTTLGELAVGARVNIEVDALAQLIDQSVRRHLAKR
ncbi:MAG: riboflavin synthase [Phycisphaerales bacterium]|nr:riboflavin synthase [Phycisphaerales bacterium]